MPANSALRRTVKRALRPLLATGAYQRIQAVSMARDIRSGAFTEPEIDLVALAVRPGEVALDLGANFGMYTYHLDRAVGPAGKVYAFEPIPFTAAALRGVARLLRMRNVEIIEKAVGAENAHVSFAVPLQGAGVPSAGQAHFAARNDERAGRQDHVHWNAQETVDCEVVRLDDVISETRAISLVKADIEGAEPFAFRGARSLIERHRPTVICEIVPWYLDGFGSSVAELMTFFDELGYRTYRYLEDPPRRLVEISHPEEVEEDNYVFVHPDRAGRLATVLEQPTNAV